MKTNYKTIQSEQVVETVIKKSRFIARILPVIDEDNAIAELKKVRSKYTDATHNVYAYIADIDGNCMRYSDDGEPSGTSAMPILEVLRRRGLVRVLAVVTRYFGGVKLGASGLVRAYTESIANALNVATEIEYKLANIYSIKIGYEVANIIEYMTRIEGFGLVEVKYIDNVEIIFSVSNNQDENVKASIIEMLKKQINIELIDKKYL